MATVMAAHRGTGGDNGVARRRGRRRLGAAAAALGALLGLVPALASPPAATAQGADGLGLIGFSNLGGDGRNGQVAVVGTTAVVGAGFLPSTAAHAFFYNPIPCPTVPVKVVDLSDPTRPRVRSTIAVPPGVAALDVDALHVTTPTFTGDLAAVALATCGFADHGPSPSFVDRGVAYYDVSDPRAPRFLGRYLADVNKNDPTPCGPPPGGSGAQCASSQHEVQLVQRPGGRVLSLSTEPFASSSGFKSGDLRIVDVTDPTAPHQVGSFPARFSVPTFSTNGCRPFNAGHGVDTTPDGRQALLAFLDEGVYDLDLSDPSAPSVIGHFSYPPKRTVEGQAGYVTFAGATRPLALVSEQDWVEPDSSLKITSPSSLAGSDFACEAVFTLFDPHESAQVYRHPGAKVPGDLAYVGHGCPGEPLLDNPAGKIAVIDRTPQPIQPPPLLFCSFADRVKRAQDRGAIGVVFAQTLPSPPFSADGVPDDISIPVFMIGRSEGDALRTVLCPALNAGGRCGAHPTVTGAMVDNKGDWGALRVLDLTDPSHPVDIGSYHPAQAEVFPPPDLGVYAPERAVASGDYAYVAWNSAGLQVLDVSSGTPVLLGSFVPPDTPDPTHTIPSKAYVQGVDLLGCGKAVITELNSGLYVVSVPPSPTCGTDAVTVSPGAAPAQAAPPPVFDGPPLVAPGTDPEGAVNTGA